MVAFFHSLEVALMISSVLLSLWTFIKENVSFICYPLVKYLLQVDFRQLWLPKTMRTGYEHCFVVVALNTAIHTSSAPKIVGLHRTTPSQLKAYVSERPSHGS
jgi:hypothetical protein